jgi:hypothetical protein
MNGSGDGGFCGGRGGGCDSGGRGNNKISCQVYSKTRQCALRYYKHFDTSYSSEETHANATTSSYNFDSDWYTDTGATDHITSKLEQLATREKYGGSNQVHATNGSYMHISHVGQSTIYTRDHNLVLKDILHVPNASKNLVSVHKFTYDNNTLFEYHLWHFSLKDRDTRKLLLRGRCRNDLYPLPLVGWLAIQDPNKGVFAVTKLTVAWWNHRLGHISRQIDLCVLSQNNLSFAKKTLVQSICDACQN